MQLNSLGSTIFLGRELRECFQLGYDIFIVHCYQGLHFLVSSHRAGDTLLFLHQGYPELYATYVLLHKALCYCCSLLHWLSKYSPNRAGIGSLPVCFLSSPLLSSPLLSLKLSVTTGTSQTILLNSTSYLQLYFSKKQDIMNDLVWAVPQA